MKAEKKESMEVNLGREPFELKKGETYSVLKLVGGMDSDLAKEFDRKMKSEIEVLTSHFILDLTECGELHPSWTRQLMTISMNMKKAGKKIRAISQEFSHKVFLQQQGISACFPIVSSLEAALADFQAKKQVTLDVTLVNPFLEGTMEVLKIQAKVESKAGAPKIKDPASPFVGDISGVIGLISDNLKGFVVISFPEATFLSIMSRMLGEDYKELTPEIQDGAAELTNIIFGHAKKVLNEKGFGIKMAIPTIVTGKNHTVQANAKGLRIVIPFESEAGPFGIEICIND